MQQSRSAVRVRMPRTAENLQQDAWRAHESLRTQGKFLDLLRPGVRESWQRSLQHHPDPDAATPSLVFFGTELAEYRAAHPMAAIMPVIQRLLVEPGKESGLLVAVGDQLGRLLWVDGDPELRRRAEGMMFMPGADWSENAIGTSAPGTALATGRSVQIAGAEHFSPQVHPWSCTAVPVHDPDSGGVLGVVDITGREEAVAVHTLALVEAAVAAAQAQLHVERLQARAPRRTRTSASSRGPALYQDSLQILGTDSAVLSLGGSTLRLSQRHSELITLLALHPRGLTAEELAVLAYPEESSVGTVRAEMLRLRKLLARETPGGAAMVPQSRPYRLPRELMVDAAQVRCCLERGAHRLALNIYRGEALPHSQAPGIVELRRSLSSVLREAVLAEAGIDTLLQYLRLPEAEDDAEAWRLALQLLPARSPRRAGIVAGMQRIERDLGCS